MLMLFYCCSICLFVGIIIGMLICGGRRQYEPRPLTRKELEEIQEKMAKDFLPPDTLFSKERTT